MPHLLAIQWEIFFHQFSVDEIAFYCVAKIICSEEKLPTIGRTECPNCVAKPELYRPEIVRYSDDDQGVESGHNEEAKINKSMVHFQTFFIDLWFYTLQFLSNHYYIYKKEMTLLITIFF